MPSQKKLVFTFYTVGKSPRHSATLQHFTAACEEALGAGSYTINSVNLLKEKSEAERKNILGTPLIIKESPQPEKRVIGDIRDIIAGRAALTYLLEEF